jgi:hypothetical protein
LDLAGGGVGGGDELLLVFSGEIPFPVSCDTITIEELVRESITSRVLHLVFRAVDFGSCALASHSVPSQNRSDGAAGGFNSDGAGEARGDE